jgi:methylated-DNA-[protein]-cysteine S-methyltransferase
VVLCTPIGRLELVDDGGTLVAIRFDAPVDGSPEHERGGSDLLRRAHDQLREYFAGERRTFDLPLRPRGTDFQRRVWNVLATVPWGTTTTYGALAVRLGLPPGAARAVGAANGANPIPVVLPCHRVIGSDGTLTGYAGGLERKALLLRLERVATEADQDALF